jgi:hypothetical protein
VIDLNALLDSSTFWIGLGLVIVVFGTFALSGLSEDKPKKKGK